MCGASAALSKFSVYADPRDPEVNAVSDLLSLGVGPERLPGVAATGAWPTL